MGLADDIINGNYRASVTNKKKKKEEESLADQIIAGTYRARLTTPSEEELDDIAPVKKQEEDTNWFSDGYDFGDITKTILGTVGNIGNFLGKQVIEPIGDFGQNYKFGKLTEDLGMEAYKKMKGEDNKYDEFKNEYDEFLAKNPELTNDAQLLDQTIQTLPNQVGALWSGIKGGGVGAGAGAIAGGIIGGLGAAVGTGGTGTAAGATAGATTGAKILGGTGYVAGSADYTYKLEAGLQYQTLIEMGVPEDIAKEESKDTGAINALIESGESILDLVTLGGISALKTTLVSGLTKKYGSKKVAEWVGKSAVKEGAEWVGKNVVRNAASEGIEEALQETTSIHNEKQAMERAELERDDSQDAKRIIQSGIAGGFAGGLIGGGTGVITGATKVGINTIQNKNQNQNQAQTQGLQQEIAKKTEEYNKSQDARKKQIIQETINGLNEELNELTNAQQITNNEANEVDNITNKTKENISKASNNDLIEMVSVEDIDTIDKTGGGHRTDAEIEALRQDIIENGITKPIEVIKDENGNIILNDGNHRLQIAKELGLKEIPVIAYTNGNFTKYTDLKNTNQTKPISKQDMKIDDEVNDYHSGESLNTMSAKIDGEVAGTLEYGEYEGKPNVKMIEVKPEYRRQGIATKLLQELQKKYPDQEIDFGMSTEDGTNLLKNITYQVENKEYVNTQKQLEKVNNRINEIETNNVWDDEIDTEYYKLLDKQRKLDKKLFDLEVDGQNTKKTFIKLDESTKDNQNRKIRAELQEKLKNSKARDEKGRLLTVYHGSPNENITEFDSSKAGSNTQADFTGLYFTDNKSVADDFSYEQLQGNSNLTYKRGKKGKVYESYLNIENPLNLNNLTDEDIENLSKYIDKQKAVDGLEFAIDTMKQMNKYKNAQGIKFHLDLEAIKNGGEYDGIIADMGGSYKGSNEYIVFDNGQVENLTNQTEANIKKIETQEKATTIKEQVEEALSPLKETISNLTEQVKTIVEQQRQQDFAHLPESEMPTEIDETELAPIEDTYEDVNSPVQERDMKEVGNRKVKAYQYEHPEVRPYFQVEADNMLGELSRRIEGERFEIIGEDGYPIEWSGVTREIPEDIAYLKDNYGYSYEQIEKGLKAIIEDNGAENNAVSKRLEILIDERLTNGYVDFLEGYPIPPNQEYKNLLIENDATDYYSNLAKTLDDADVPLEQTTMNVEPELKVSEQVIPIAEKTAQNGNTGVEEAKQRSWAKTSTESDVVKGKILLNDLDAEKIQYVPITNKATLAEANETLESLGYEEALDQFYGKIKSGKLLKPVDVTLGQRLMQESLAKGDKATAIEILQDIAMLDTELGQIIQATSIIQRMTPAGQLRMLEKTVKRGKLRGDKAFKGLKLTEDMQNRIMDCYNEDGVTHNQDKLNEVMEQIKQELADQMPVTAMEKINAWRYLSMLGNPKTHGRNIISNVANIATIEVKNAMARTIEDLSPIENRTKTWKPASQEIKDFAKQTATEMKDIILGENQVGIKAEIKSKRKIFKNFLEKLTNGNSNVMTTEDWLFSGYSFKKSLQEFLTANGIKTQQDIQNNPELVEKGKQYALEQSQIATFRQYSWLASKINEFERKNAATQIAVGAVLPFKKTPINIAKAGLNYSPLGFAKTLTYDISQVKKGNMEASTLIDHIAQNTTGTALTLVGYMLAQAGFLNGAGDDDKEGKYDYQLGKQAYSINIGGNTYSLSWLSPVAMPLFVGANAYEQLVEGEEWNTDVVLETLGQTLDPLSEMSFLSSLDSVLSSYDSGVQRFFGIGEAMAQNYVTQFVPTASSQLAATLDDTKRSTKVSGDSTMKVLEETYNKLIYKIPFLREALEPTTDIWGNEVKQNENLFTRTFENFIAPYSRKESIATEIDNELKDLYSQTGDNGLLPSIPYNYVNYDGEKYNMSAEEYTDYKKAYGQTANDLLEDLFRTTTYKNATSEERADMVNDVYDYARDEAKLDYLGKEGVDYTNATKEGEEYYKVNDIKGAIDNDMTVDEYRLYSEKPEKYNFFKENGISYKDYDENKDLYNYAYEHQDKYAASKAITGDFETYYSHIETMGDFDAKDEYGNSVNGLKKERVFNYVNSLDLDEIQKAIMFKMQYPKDDDYVGNGYNNAIVQYVGGLDMTYEEMVQVIEGLGMTVDSDGNVYW